MKRRGLVDALLHTARNYPDRIAVIDGDEAYTYLQLDRRSSEMSGGLLARGVTPGAVVAIESTRSWLRCAAVLAAWRVGAGVLSLDPGMPIARSRRVLASSGCALLVHAGTASSAEHARGLCSLDDLAGESVTTVAEGQIAYVIPTSGSTGEPKSVAVPPVVLADLGAWHVDHWRHDVIPNTLHAASIGFDVIYEDMVATWMAGAALVVVTDDDRRDPFALPSLINKYGVARLFLPVASLHGLAMAVLFDDANLPTLREIAVAGEQLVINDEVRAFCTREGVALINQYGPSETHVVTQYRMPPDPESWPDYPPIGTAVVSAELLCHNGGELRPFKRSETAELVIAGECVGLGYLGDRSLTEQKFATVPHVDGGMRRCYFSGDLVTYDGANFQFVARVDEQLKVKGYRVEPGDVEAAIAGIDGVRRAAVLGVQKGGVTLLAALYTCQAEAEVTEERVREECARLLPEYMVPSFIHRLNSLPVTENGKIDRSRLSAMVATDSPRPARGGSRES